MHILLCCATTSINRKDKNGNKSCISLRLSLMFFVTPAVTFADLL